MVQWIEFRGQDEHEVAVGVTQYTLSAEQERVLMSSAATMTVNPVHQTIVYRSDCRLKSILYQYSNLRIKIRLCVF